MSDDINLLETDVEVSLRSTLRDLLADHCDPTSVMRAYEGDHALTPVLWKAVASDLGLAGLLVPESRGGVGASAREAAVVLNELGRSVAPVPFLSSAVEATTVLLAGGSGLVEELASGDRTAALLVPFSAAADSPLPAIDVDSAGRLTGRVTSVAGALEADFLLAAVGTPVGTEVYAVRANAATVTPFVSLDMTRPLADVVLDGAVGELVVGADAGAGAVRRALATSAALLPSEQAGVAAWCSETTVEYLKIRRQFGRAVGGFQALKHRLADLFAEVESASAAAWYAAGALASGAEDAAIAAEVASSYCGDAAVHAAEEAVQLHGGIGMTWEHPVHLYLKRAKADQIGRGLPAHHRGVLAGLVDLPS
ncbi:Acyl-CoA dehydrogenase [Saccharopolyspora antimicrobica]|uniref:Acyl-CoA dehydrogenase n=1 Tax=Saccharopolyspora antimicrobica TaxID=455193 RepID=A0A1I5C9J5_9PSEU|nr:acyl-CoA dehydrogenase family protein [Saccharopolyspora antimicrobica]RKT88936.1 alkylation response protein AidB-like acyl-CoA dehydrogenase [Saccharopolyspora antimicrobica]SFN83311.1 Acyl-CoA dehydrogenase [Saccharopolyspora antimicrobica]